MTWLPYIFLSALGWSMVNVLDSLLVRNYEKSPVILMWSQSLFSVVALLALAAFHDVRTEWWPFLLAMGITAYAADLFFFWVLDRVDVSVVNVGWAMLTLLLSSAGFAFFRESWTFAQAVGVALVLGGVLLLSLQHTSERSFAKVLGILFIMALLYTPSYIAKKAALNGGQAVFVVFFWSVIGREILAFVFPWTVRGYRRHIKRLAGVADWKFFAIGGMVIASFLFGEFNGAMAFSAGPLSLVTVASNIQPFIVMALAAAVAHVMPSHAPKEALTRRSVLVKLASFAVVFGGLALLALPK